MMDRNRPFVNSLGHHQTSHNGKNHTNGTQPATSKQSAKPSNNAEFLSHHEDTDNMHRNFNIRDYLDCDVMTQEEIDRCEFWVTANQITRESNKENYEGVQIQVNNTWNFSKLEEWLEDYHDHNLIKYLKFGWPLNAVNTAEDFTIPVNQQRARDNPDDIREYISKELKHGAIIGPFKKNPFGRKARFSPLDTRPKRDTTEKRVIMNLSYPFEGDSINSSIKKDEYAENEVMDIKYPKVDDLAAIIRTKSENSNNRKVQIMKRDLSRAYRQLFSLPNSIHLLGFTFENHMYFDVTLSMGSASAAYCCQRTTNTITFIYKKLSYDDVNYLDNLGSAEIDELADAAFDCLGWILNTIGIQESPKKACPPAFVIIFLGILFNTIDMTMTITAERLQEIKSLLRTWEFKKTTDLRELQVLLGKLNFASSTIRAGRVFLSHIISEIRNFPVNRHRRVSKELKKDVNWWLTFMEEFDGISILPTVNWDAPDIVFSTDSCLERCGGWAQINSYQGEAFTLPFPKYMMEKEQVHINEKELMAFIVALKIWQERIKNRNVLAYCDNRVSVDIVNKGITKNSFSQACMREIIYLTAKCNAVLKLVFREGQNNRISDGLSRFHTISE